MRKSAFRKIKIIENMIRTWKENIARKLYIIYLVINFVYFYYIYLWRLQKPISVNPTFSEKDLRSSKSK